MRIRLIWRRALLVAALLTLVLALAPATSHSVVHAAGTGTVFASPTAVTAGSPVTLTGSGYGYAGGQQVYITLSPAFPGTVGNYVVATTDPTTGAFSFSYPLNVPPTVSVGQVFAAVVNVTNSSSVSTVQTTFTIGSTSTNTVAASVTLNGLSTSTPVTVYTTPGSAITAIGINFSGTGTVLLSSASLGVSQYVSNPTFSTSFYIPTTTVAGTYTLTASDASRTAYATIIVQGTGSTIGTMPASVALNGLATSTPVTVYTTPGSLITVTGFNFSGTGTVLLSSSSLGVSQSLSDPSFSTSFTIPSTTVVGTYLLTASDSIRTAYATIIVQATTSTAATLVNTPSAAAPNQVIGITGSGFAASATVTLSGLGTAVTTTASTTGTISASITVPSAQATGTVTLVAQDAYGHYATVSERIGLTGIAVTPSASSANVGGALTVSGTGFQAGEVVTVGLAASSALPTFISGTTVTFTADASGNYSGSYTVPNQPIGSYLLLASGGSSRIQATTSFAIAGVAATATSTPLPVATAGFVPFPTVAATATPVVGPLAAAPSTATTTYFAEGYTGTAATNGQATFTEKLYLFNAGPVASNVTTTYYVYDTKTNTHTTVVEHDTVAPGVTAVRAVNTDAGNDRNVSIVVQASAGISAETVISRVAKDGSILDTGSSKGSAGLNQTWYLAEGYTGASIQEYLTIFNPGTTDAHTQVRYMPSDTTAPAAQAVTVPAGGRTTINVRSVYNGLVKKGSRNIGISVTSDQAIAVDRAMYWGDGSGSGKYGYSVGPGINSGQTLQYFSYLPTSSGSQSFVTVLNTSSGTATVALSLRDSFGGSIVPVQLSIGAGQRATFSLPTLVSSSFGVITGILSSNTPVVAEAGIYFNGSPNIGRHPGTVVQGTTGTPLGARANVAPAGAQLRIVNVSGSLIRVQVLSKGAGTSNILYDATITNRNAKTILIPAGTDPRSIQVLGSGTFSATLINGGDGSSTAWGGNLN